MASMSCFFFAFSSIVFTFVVDVHSYPSPQGIVRHDQPAPVAKYLELRKELSFRDNRHRTGQNITLSPIELKANAILSELKRIELEKQRETDDSVAAGYFLSEKERIESSPVFKIIKKMPKGAVLHLHRESMASYKWLIDEFVTRDTCYMCYNTTTELVEFKISSSVPNATKSCAWKTCPAVRASYSDPTKFDNDLLNNLTLISKDTQTLYPTQELLWKKFQSIFTIVGPLLGNDESFVSYYEQGLRELLDDNIQYAEVRSLLPTIQNAAGKTFTHNESVAMLLSKSKEFVANHSNDFFQPKLIIIEPRAFDRDIIAASIDDAIKLRKSFPDFVAGYDLVGQEDAGHSLLYFIKELLSPMNEGIDLPYFFHAGETDWEGSTIDENLIDALLLNTTRIGHGYALTKHPELLKTIKERGVAIEVCPISNQILGLLSDLRDHPAAAFLSDSVPMTVNSDDPAIWNISGTSYDFYEVFMGMTRDGDDLRLLKQLAIDSIRYSALSADDKATVLDLWARKWTQFIEEVVVQFS